MAETEKQIVSVGGRLAKYIGAKASRDKKLQAASMMAEFTLHDTLIILCYLGRDPDPEISSQARKNLIPAARSWYSRPDRPELPKPIYEIVMKVIDRIGLGDQKVEEVGAHEKVEGDIGLLGLGEMIQAVDHNNRTVCISLNHKGTPAQVYTQSGKVVGAVMGEEDGLEALYKMFGWLDAGFSYSHGEPGYFRNRIKINTLTLVMDALEYSPDEDPYESDISLTWQVRGHLKVMNIFEIAEIFEMNSKPAVCELKRQGAHGKLFFRNGRVANAVLDPMSGMDAACHLLAWPNADFVITRGGEEMDEIIHVGMQNLIIEAMRLVDEGVTVTDDKMASELRMIDELFEGRDVMTMPVLDKIRMVFAEDERAREQLETDANPVVRKAIKVKISKTVHKYLNPTTDHQLRLKAARGMVPMSTTEKLVLLSYLSHDESQEIREEAKQTLGKLDMPTYRKGFGSDLHPSVVDFLIRETIRDEILLKAAVSSENILEETALYVLDTWPQTEIVKAVLDNTKLLDRSPSILPKISQLVAHDPVLKQKVDAFEESVLQGHTDRKVEGPLSLCGLGGLLRAARAGARSGTVVIDSAPKTGRIFIRKGRIIGALSTGHEGLKALEDMVSWTNARFRYTLRTYFHTENLDTIKAEDFLSVKAPGPSILEGDSSGMRLMSGSVEIMDVFEVLSATEDTPTPLCLSIICEEGAGEIFRDGSRILHVQVPGKDTPLQALAAIISWTASRFILRPAVGAFPTTLDKSLADAFMESMKLIPDEMKQLTKPGELPEWELSEQEFESLYRRILDMGVAEKIKLAFLGNKEAREILVRDPIKLVATAVIKSPKVQEGEIETVSKSRQISEDVLRQISMMKEWTKSYQIKLNLAGNPKTPVPVAMRFLNQLRGSDLRKLAKDKNVSQTIANHARRLAETKGDK